MNFEEKKLDKKEWKKPEIIDVNLKEYENVIEASARSGGGCACGCAWQVGCTAFF